MNKITALFVGGPADGKRMEINACMRDIQIPHAPKIEPLFVSDYWHPVKDAQPYLDLDFTTYRVHILDLRDHGPVAVCTTDFDLDYQGVLVALMQGYNPDREKSDPIEKEVDQILARLESYYHGDDKLARGAKHLSVNTDDLRTLTDYVKFMRAQMRAANRK